MGVVELPGGWNPTSVSCVLGFRVIELTGGDYDGDDVSVTMYEPLLRFLKGTDGDVSELNILEECLVQARSGFQTLTEISNLLPK